MILVSKDLAVGAILPAPVNPNEMTPEKFEALKEAIRVHGFVQPALVHDNGDGTFEMVDGHHRLKAAVQLGTFPTIPCVVGQFTQEQRITLRMALSLHGEMNLSVVREQLIGLVEDGWAPEALVPMTGYSIDEMVTLTASVDDGPDVSQAGDSATPAPAATAAKPFVLEISFTDAKTMRLAKRKLMKASGDTKDLAAGLLAVLGEEN